MTVRGDVRALESTRTSQQRASETPVLEQPKKDMPARGLTATHVQEEMRLKPCSQLHLCSRDGAHIHVHALVGDTAAHIALERAVAACRAAAAPVGCHIGGLIGGLPIVLTHCATAADGMDPPLCRESI